MKRCLVILITCFYSVIIPAQNKTFDIVPLGVYGGGLEGNLSSYLIGESNKNNFVCFDAGTIGSGIKAAVEKGTFLVSENEVLKNYIKAYFITHGHLDHNSGLIINSPADIKKPIYGFDFVINIYKDHYFINDTWINFANEGQPPILNKYNYNYVTKGVPTTISDTQLTITPFELDHVAPYKSSAALIQNSSGDYVLYLSDTGADRIEGGNQLDTLWQTIAPIVKANRLKALMIEVSFPNKQPEHLLFGHLTPKLLQEELASLSKYTGTKALKNLNVIVTHIKPEGTNEQTIVSELQNDNSFKVNYIFPKQGEKITL
jgi:cAMP phosphodiesterase